MSTSLLITIVICVTLVAIFSISEICDVLSKKYDHENILKSESEEK